MARRERFGRRLPGTHAVPDGQGFYLGHTATLPVCDASRDGELRYQRGGTGVADTIVCCQKDASENYAWEAIATAAGFLPLSGGTLTGALVIDPGNEVASLGTTAVVFNEDGADIDFRVEADVCSEIFRVDAGLNAVRSGCSIAGEYLDLRTSSLTINEGGGDYDFRVESDTLTHALAIDGGTGEPRVGYLAGTGDRLVQADADGDLSAGIRVITGSATFNPGNTANGAAAATTVTVTGAAAGDPAICAHTTIDPLTGSGWRTFAGSISSADACRCVWQNNTGASSDPASGTATCIVLKLP